MDLLDHLPEAVLVLDARRVLTGCNDRSGPLLGVTAADVGRALSEVLVVLDGEGRVCEDPLPARGVADRIAEQDLRVQLADGRERGVSMAGRWQEDGGVVLSFRSSHRSPVSGRAESELVATASHELRAPLASIEGFTRSLLEDWQRRSDEQKRALVATIHEDAERVSRLLRELLAAGRIGADRVPLDRSAVDVAALVGAVVRRARVRPEAADRELSVTVAEGTPTAVEVDGDRVDQVVTNLVDNALRHAPGSDVAVIVGPWSDRGVRVDVTDDGPGVPPDRHDEIFRRFGRGRDSQAPGTGLGLYIARGLGRAHDGDVVLDSPVDGGATFTLLLPGGDPGRAAR